MDEQRARTILDAVSATWNTSVRALLNSSSDELAEDLEERPVEGVTVQLLEMAIRRHLSVKGWVG